MDEEYPLSSLDSAPANDGDAEPRVPDRSTDRPAIHDRTRGDLERVERWSA